MDLGIAGGNRDAGESLWVWRGVTDTEIRNSSSVQTAVPRGSQEEKQQQTLGELGQQI